MCRQDDDLRRLVVQAARQLLDNGQNSRWVTEAPADAIIAASRGASLIHMKKAGHDDYFSVPQLSQ